MFYEKVPCCGNLFVRHGDRRINMGFIYLHNSKLHKTFSSIPKKLYGDMRSGMSLVYSFGENCTFAKE